MNQGVMLESLTLFVCFCREEMRLTSDFSSSSSDNGAISPVEMLEGQNGHTLEKQSSTERWDSKKSQKQLWSGYKEHDLKKDTGTLRWLGLINNQKGMLRPTLACYWTGWSGFRRVSARSEWYNSWISMSRTLITQVILLLEFKWVVQRNVEVLIYADTHANYNGGRR